METNVNIQRSWMNLKPYDKPGMADHYYISVCMAIRKRLKDPEVELEEHVAGFPDFNVGDFVAFMVSYFEDVVSELGLWKAFTEKNYELYGRYLPFYKGTGCDNDHYCYSNGMGDINNADNADENDDYYPGDINRQDIAFLIWYYLTAKGHMHEDAMVKMVNPLSPWIMNMAADLFTLFDERFERAPENSILKSFIRSDANETDFYSVRFVIQWLCTSSWLFGFMGEWLAHKVKELYEEEPELISEHGMDLLKDLKDQIAFAEPFPLLALKGHEWYALILGKEHSLFSPLMGIGEKQHGTLIYRGFDDQNVKFEVPANGEEIWVKRSTLPEIPDVNRPGDVLSIGLVRWMNEWWFSGIYFYIDNMDHITPDSMDEIIVNSLRPYTASRWRQDSRVYKNFIKFNHDSPAAYFADKKEANEFLRQFTIYCNSDIGLEVSDEDIQLPLSDMIDDIDSDVIFIMDEKRGFAVNEGIAAYIPDSRNPYYKGDFSEDIASHFLFNQQFSLALFKYTMKLGDQLRNQLRFPGDVQPEFDDVNIDFLLRFYKRDEYPSTSSTQQL